MPKFSVIMPVYNNEKYFPNAVASILSQGYEDYELIIVDDGSTDNTSFIADEFVKEYTNIQVIHQENQWIYASFNNGIQAASGEYIYILNSDDRLRPGVLKKMSNIVDRYNPDVIWTKVLTHVCDAEQNIIHYDKNRLDRLVLEDQFFKNQEEVHANWLYLHRSLLLQNQANLYRKSLMLKHKFRNDVYGADTLFNISIASDINSAYVMSEPVYDFFIYNEESRNASVGKYYEYEHAMFLEIYQKNKDLFVGWGKWTKETQIYFGNMLLQHVSAEIRLLFADNCLLSADEKIENVFCSVIDDTIYQCACSLNRLEELESRILSGCREVLLKEHLQEGSQMYFTYELLESLLRYEKDESDYVKIRNAIFHPYNRYHIGQIFYKKLRRTSNV